MATIRIKTSSEEILRLVKPRENCGRISIGMDDKVWESFYISLDRSIPFKNQARTLFDKTFTNLAEEANEPLVTVAEKM